jgi:hypothetical protein
MDIYHLFLLYQYNQLFILKKYQINEIHLTYSLCLSPSTNHPSNWQNLIWKPSIYLFIQPITIISVAYPYTYTMKNQGNNVCTIVLKRTSTISQSTILIAKTTSSPPSILRSDYFRLRPKDHKDKDL